MTSETQQPTQDQPDKGRRNFLKLGLAGAGTAALAAGGVTIAKRLEGIPHEEFPVPLNEEFQRIDQRTTVLTYAGSKRLNEKYPERNENFNKQLQRENLGDGTPFNFYEKKKNFYRSPYQDVPGYTQLDKALAMGAGSNAMLQLAFSKGGMEGVNRGALSWEQAMLAPVQYQFPSPKEASVAIKSAAKLYGAVRCGITPRDERWDYERIYDLHNDEEISWDDFPFKPKSVIVLFAEMQYESMAAAPAWTADGTVGDAYANAIKIASQTAVFLRQLGYQAVASLNDLGVNAPYAIAAGLGEGARSGQIITPVFGPRLRISKVYTDFDLVEYDQPRTFGVASFCKNCKRCADSCPGNAITFEDPTWEPTYSENPEDMWNNCKGVFKFHNDSKKCFKFWMDNDGSCGNCIASCPYNKPDFWHHRVVDAANVVSPGPVHSIMREMDILFGYGAVGDVDRVKRFYRTGSKI